MEKKKILWIIFRAASRETVDLSNWLISKEKNIDHITFYLKLIQGKTYKLPKVSYQRYLQFNMRKLINPTESYQSPLTDEPSK